MNDIDKKIKIMLDQINSSSPMPINGNCHDDITLACYVDGILEKDKNEKVERHLASCNNCLDLLVLQSKIRQEESEITGSEEAPEAWVERAIALFPDNRKGIEQKTFDIVIRFAKDTIEVIKNPGNLWLTCGASPVAIRGNEKSVEFVTLSKVFANTKLEVEIEPAHIGFLNMRMKITDSKSGRLLEGMRINLFSHHREIASCIAKNGEIYFEGFKLGEYSVKITGADREIGHISMDLKG